MKIDLKSIPADFSVREFQFHGEALFLVDPQNPFEANWTQDNLIFRSSIWNKEGELVSAGFKKFGNWLEKPDLWPVPKTLVNCDLVEKCDGSLLILSKYKGNLLIRTRGSSDAYEKGNGQELDILKAKYPKIIEALEDEDVSILLEWVSPTNKIVIDYKEPEFYLIGVVNHINYSLFNQGVLDFLASTWEIPRPARYRFDSISEMLETIKQIEGKEGLCLYAPGGDIFKVKSDWYLKRHAFKSQVSLNSLIDLYLDWARPNKDKFVKKIEAEFDFECAEIAKPLIEKIYQSVYKVEDLLESLRVAAEEYKKMPRKEAALKIKLLSYSGLIFQLLDGKEPNQRQQKELLLQFTQKT